ncbi:hypothetical protein TNCV_3097981 [Trichonephila clavipes]|nr:hypothetical protein TNCV_3097981 [Trichonephila clavipes]
MFHFPSATNRVPTHLISLDQLEVNFPKTLCEFCRQDRSSNHASLPLPTNYSGLSHQSRPSTSGHIHKIRYGMEERFAFHFPSDDQRPATKSSVMKKISRQQHYFDLI